MRNTSIAGHQVSIVSANVGQLGDLRVGAPLVERPEPLVDLVSVPAAGGGRAQRPQFLLRDPRRQDLIGRVVVTMVHIAGQLQQGPSHRADLSHDPTHRSPHNSGNSSPRP
jgi:hypothetical protein